MSLWLKSFVAIFITLVPWGQAFGGEPQLLPYKGRLVGPNGDAIKGPVDLELEFFGSEAAADRRLPAPLRFKQVLLNDGVFDLSIALEDSELRSIFRGGAAFVQVTDLTHRTTYHRNRLSAPPGILGDVLQPSPRAAPSEARALSAASTIRSATAFACLASPAAGAKFVTDNSDLKRSCASTCAAAMPEATCVRGWTIYAGERYFDFGNECLVADLPEGDRATARVCCCQSLAGPGSLFLGTGNVAH